MSTPLVISDLFDEVPSPTGPFYIRLRRFLKKTETENRQEKTEKNRKTGFLSINNTETKFIVARAVAHLHVFLLGYEL